MTFVRPRSKLLLCGLALNSLLYCSTDPDAYKKYSPWEFKKKEISAKLSIENPNQNSRDIKNVCESVNTLEISVIALYIIKFFEKDPKSKYPMRDLDNFRTELQKNQGKSEALQDLNGHFDFIVEQFIPRRKEFIKLVNGGEAIFDKAVGNLWAQFINNDEICYHTFDPITRKPTDAILSTKVPVEDDANDMIQEAEKIYSDMKEIIKRLQGNTDKVKFADGLLKLYEARGMKSDELEAVFKKIGSLTYCNGFENFRKSAMEWAGETLSWTIKGVKNDNDKTKEYMGLWNFAMLLFGHGSIVMGMLAADWCFLRLNVSPTTYCCAVMAMFVLVGIGRKDAAEALKTPVLTYILVLGANILGFKQFVRILGSAFAKQMGIVRPGFTELYAKNPFQWFFSNAWRSFRKPTQERENSGDF